MRPLPSTKQEQVLTWASDSTDAVAQSCSSRSRSSRGGCAGGGLVPRAVCAVLCAGGVVNGRATCCGACRCLYQEQRRSGERASIEPLLLSVQAWDLNPHAPDAAPGHGSTRKKSHICELDPDRGSALDGSVQSTFENGDAPASCHVRRRWPSPCLGPVIPVECRGSRPCVGVCCCRASVAAPQPHQAARLSRAPLRDVAFGATAAALAGARIDVQCALGQAATVSSNIMPSVYLACPGSGDACCVTRAVLP